MIETIYLGEKIIEDNLCNWSSNEMTILILILVIFSFILGRITK